MNDVLIKCKWCGTICQGYEIFDKHMKKEHIENSSTLTVYDSSDMEIQK